MNSFKNEDNGVPVDMEEPGLSYIAGTVQRPGRRCAAGKGASGECAACISRLGPT